MATLALEKPPTVSRTWIDVQPAKGLLGYLEAATASADFATEVLRAFHGTIVGLSSNPLSTFPDHSSAQEKTSLPKVPQAVTVDASQDHPDLPRAEARLSYLASLDLSKSFEDLEEPSLDTIREAGVLLRKLAAFGRDRNLPDLGLDSDGSLVFSFHPERTGMVGSLSVFGDGTYSYCIELNGTSVDSGAARVSAPFSDELKALLTR
jgi:hypothetical protein